MWTNYDDFQQQQKTKKMLFFFFFSFNAEFDFFFFIIPAAFETSGVPDNRCIYVIIILKPNQ